MSWTTRHGARRIRGPEGYVVRHSGLGKTLSKAKTHDHKAMEETAKWLASHAKKSGALNSQ